MKLTEYLTAQGIRDVDFAARSGIRQSCLSRYRAGQTPGWDTMRIIFYATDGAVTPNDFAPFPLDPPPCSHAAPALPGDRGGEP